VNNLAGSLEERIPAGSLEERIPAGSLEERNLANNLANNLADSLGNNSAWAAGKFEVERQSHAARTVAVKHTDGEAEACEKSYLAY